MPDQDLVALVDLVLDGVGVAVAAEKDGKISVADLPLLMSLVPDLGPAFANIKAVPAEIAAMNQDEAIALVAHVMAKLSIADGHARGVIDASLKAALALYALFEAVKAPAPVAAA